MSAAAPTHPLDSPRRLSALAASGLLDSPDEDAFDRLTKLTTLLLHTPVALVSLVDDHRQFFKSQVGLPEPWATARETPLSHSFCQHVVMTGEALIIPDARLDSRVSENLAIRDLGVIAYAGIPLTTAEGEPLGSFCAIDTKPRDWSAEEIDVLKTLATAAIREIQLRESVSRLEKANAIRDQLIGLVSHEIRTPLGGILGVLRLMEMDATDATDRTYLDMALQSAEALLRLLNDLLSLEQIESGKFVVAPVEVAASEILTQVEHGMSAVLAESGLTLAIQPTTSRVIADRDRIAQVLNNLIGNARKFSPAGSTITVSAVPRHGKIEFSVADQGRGIPADKIELIFERFQQVESGDKHEKGGAGLGLAICRAIIEQHNGRIWAESEPGKGSTFRFVIPMA